MSEEIKEEVEKSPLSNLTKEEVLETVKKAFTDNEEALKHIDNIINNLLEIKKLEVNSPGSASFMMWILPILVLFSGPNYDGLDKDLLESIKKNESNSENGESDPVEEGTQCS